MPSRSSNGLVAWLLLGVRDVRSTPGWVILLVAAGYGVLIFLFAWGLFG